MMQDTSKTQDKKYLRIYIIEPKTSDILGEGGRSLCQSKKRRKRVEN